MLHYSCKILDKIQSGCKVDFIYRKYVIHKSKYCGDDLRMYKLIGLFLSSDIIKNVLNISSIDRFYTRKLILSIFIKYIPLKR